MNNMTGENLKHNEMATTIHTKISRTVKLSLPLLAVLIMASCSEEKTELTPLVTPSLNPATATVSSLTFTWDAVGNVSEYVYELRDPDGEISDGGVTSYTTVTLTGLKPSTVYTLNVWAYPAVGGPDKVSEVATITGRTADIVQLATPAVRAEVNGSSVTLSWTAVENAETYWYCHEDSEGNATEWEQTSSTSVKISALATGSHTFLVYADSDDEAYSASGTASVPVEITRVERYRTTASFTYYGANWESTIIAYADGGYSVIEWYGSPYDANMDFSIIDGTVVWDESYYNDGEYIYIPYETSNNEYYLYVMDCELTITGLTYTLTIEEYYGTCIITWNAPLTIYDFEGSYSMASTGSECIEQNDWTDFSYTDEIEIKIVDDNTVSFVDPYWYYYEIEGTVDFETNTIMFAPQEIGYYTFCKYDTPDEGIVATFDEDFTIKFSDWTAYYADYTFSYIYGTETILTKL